MCGGSSSAPPPAPPPEPAKEKVVFNKGTDNPEFMQWKNTRNELFRRDDPNLLSGGAGSTPLGGTK